LLASCAETEPPARSMLYLVGSRETPAISVPRSVMPLAAFAVVLAFVFQLVRGGVAGRNRPAGRVVEDTQWLKRGRDILPKNSFYLAIVDFY
jgi:hypothetical protein